MNRHVKPAPVEPSGRPLSAPPAGHWTNDWTIADCIEKFEWVPWFFTELNPDTKLARVWPRFTLEWQSKLDVEFVSYDLRTGRV